MSTQTVKSFDILQLPSIKQGMTKEEEADKRLKTCHFIREAAKRLRLPQSPQATAMVFFHRFYAKHSFQEHDRFEVAVASLVLAAKVEESPKRVDQVILECVKLKNASSQSGRLSAQPKSATSPKAGPDGSIDVKGEEFLKLKERVLLLERIHLHTIGFDLFVEHPYKFALDQMEKLTATRRLQYKPDSTGAKAAQEKSPSQIMASMNYDIKQYSINFINDSLNTPLCLQFGPKLIGTACMFLACCYANIEPVDKCEWLDVLDNPDLEALVSICEQILDVLDRRRGNDTNRSKKIRVLMDVWRGSTTSESGEDGGSSTKRLKTEH